MVECSPATRAARVRFPADAKFFTPYPSTNKYDFRPVQHDYKTLHLRHLTYVLITIITIFVFLVIIGLHFLTNFDNPPPLFYAMYFNEMCHLVLIDQFLL